jgi:hypothetical protein
MIARIGEEVVPHLSCPDWTGAGIERGPIAATLTTHCPIAWMDMWHDQCST